MKTNSKFKITKQGLGLGVLFYFLFSLISGSILVISENLPFLMALFSAMMTYAPMALLTIWIYYFCRIYAPENKSIVLFLCNHILMAFAVSLIAFAIDYGYEYLLYGNAVFIYKPVKNVGVYLVLQGIVIYGVLAAVFYSLFYQKRIHEKEMRSAELEAETRQAELKALKSQINPHFLFNTLNTIFALMDTDIKQAKDTVTELSDLLRYSMASFYQEKINLKDELNMTKRYLDIEKVRFTDRLTVRYEVNEDLLSHSVPPMILQPLVENAIKHGIAPLKMGGDILISIQKENDSLQIKVEDTGRGNTQNHESVKKNGIGLKNLKKRLQMIYEDNFTLIARPKSNSGFIAVLSIPIE